MEHGTWSGYTTHDCRCRRCVEAARIYQLQRRARNVQDLRSLPILDPDDARCLLLEAVERAYGLDPHPDHMCATDFGTDTLA